MAKKEYNLRLLGTVGSYAIDPEYIVWRLDRDKDKPLCIHVDSPGGSVAAALTIAAAFRDHGDVTVHITGLTASAATILSLGATRITMDRAAIYMVHNCSVEVFKWADLNKEQLAAHCAELEKKIDTLDKLDTLIAAQYAARCRKRPDDLKDLMKHETFLTAQEALEWGFIDEITDYEEDTPPVINDATVAQFAALGITIPEKYRPKKSPVEKAKAKLSKLLNMEKQTPDTAAENTNTNATAAAAESTPAAKPNTAAKTNVKAESGLCSEQSEGATSAQSTTDAKDDEIARLKAELAELKAKQPGDSGTAVITTGAAHTTENDFCASFASAEKLFKSLP